MLPYTIEEIRRRVTPVAEKYRLAAVWLFGSYARGEATVSRFGASRDAFLYDPDFQQSISFSLLQIGSLPEVSQRNCETPQ